MNPDTNQPQINQDQDMVLQAPVTGAIDKKWTPRRTIRIILICVGVGIGIICLLVPTIVIGGLLLVSNGCTTRTNNLEKNVPLVRQQLESLNTSYATLSRVDVAPNGDCLTGSGVGGTVYIAVNNETVTSAYDKLMRTTFSNRKPDILLLGEPYYKSTNTRIDGVTNGATWSTEGLYSYNGQDYSITIEFIDPVDCNNGFETSSACGYQRTNPVQKYDLYTKPVKQIILSTTKQID